MLYGLGVGVNASIPKFPLILLDLQGDICYNRLTCSLNKEFYVVEIEEDIGVCHV